MDTSIFDIIYGEDYKPLFDGKLVMAYDTVKSDGKRSGYIYESEGIAFIGARVADAIPLKLVDNIVGYAVITPEIDYDMYSKFYKIVKGVPKRQSTVPFYVKLLVINQDLKVDTANCLISADTYEFPSMIIKYRGHSYYSKFDKQKHILEYFKSNYQGET